MNLYFLLVSLFLSNIMWGQTPPTTRLHYVQEFYSGEKSKTFDRENVANGLEMMISTKRPHLNYFTKGRFTVVSGSQEFLDGAAEVDSSFQYYKSSFEVGGLLYPISRKSRNVSLYLGLSGIVSYNYISLSSDDFTEIKSSYQAMSFGYAGSMGVEWLVFNNYALTAEFSQRFESADLVEVSNFSLNSFSISLGLGW